MIISTLVKPDVFAKLDAKDIERISDIIDAEIVRSPEIQKLLSAKVDEYVRKSAKVTSRATKKP